MLRGGEGRSQLPSGGGTQGPDPRKLRTTTLLRLSKPTEEHHHTGSGLPEDLGLVQQGTSMEDSLKDAGGRHHPSSQGSAAADHPRERRRRRKGISGLDAGGGANRSSRPGPRWERQESGAESGPRRLTSSSMLSPPPARQPATQAGPRSCGGS